MIPYGKPVATEADDDAQADRITWRQILVGYALVSIMLLVLGAGLFSDAEGMKGILIAIVVAATLLSMLLEKPAAAFHRAVLSENPALDDTLQWVAIGALLFLSAGTIAFGILTLPVSG